METGATQDRGPRAERIVLVVIALIVAACVGGELARESETSRIAWREGQGAVHGWWQERGLVIPHATFPADCRLCHLEGDWSKLRDDFVFDHARETGVSLEGAHAAAQCLRCHNDRGPVVSFAERGCIGCHTDVHEGARGTGCADCHGQEDWRVEEDLLAHARTRFPLVGPHAAAACRDCHLGIESGLMEPLDTACVACHTDDLDRALDPDHRALGWTSRCDECHQVSTFGAAGFVHAAFPLEGGHAALDCSACHLGSQFTGTSSACASCHADDYAGALDPPHASLGIPMACQECHTTSSWQGAAFEHTAWALTGAHRQASCSACHGGGVFVGTPTNCIDCHQSDLSGATDPNHAAAGFATTCQDCHGTSAWEPASYVHPGFALTGAHSAQSCNACHGGGVFSGTPSACVGCHQAAYNATTNPNHVQLGFPTSCQDCHGTATWAGASFEHATWPLTGAHAAQGCAECHGGGVFTGTPTACAACHQAEYNATTNPNHGALGFPTTCQDCHTTATWTGATFVHTWFPIQGGDHGGLSCSECHQVPGNPSSFSCTHCHEHRQSEMDSEHQGVAGYVWQSSACYQCHPDGQEHAREAAPSRPRARGGDGAGPSTGADPVRSPRGAPTRRPLGR